MFDVGVPELVLILVVALIVFGPGKLPEIGASLGKAMKEFRGATQGLTDELQSATRLDSPMESETEMRARLLQERQEKAAAHAQQQPQSEVIPPVPVAAAATEIGTEPADPIADKSTTQPVGAHDTTLAPQTEAMETSAAPTNTSR